MNPDDVAEYEALQRVARGILDLEKTLETGDCMASLAIATALVPIARRMLEIEHEDDFYFDSLF